MAVLLARTAERLYWGARYVERAEDTSRVIRAFNELVVDYPSQELLRWEPLAAIHGSAEHVKLTEDDPSGEHSVLTLLISDRDNPSSVLSTVASARENLRTTREVMPREAWQAINQLSQYVEATASAAIGRQLRDHFLVRVIEVSRRLDGILESTMSRGSSYRMLRLGRLVERADMTTRVLGVAAAGILLADDPEFDGVIPSQIRWMNVLRSVSALQMYQRSDHGPIDGLAVVRFLLYWESFPRSVQGCLDEIRTVVEELPRPDGVLAAVSRAEAVLSGADPGNADAERLDRAMDRVQVAIYELSRAIHANYVDSSL